MVAGGSTVAIEAGGLEREERPGSSPSSPRQIPEAVGDPPRRVDAEERPARSARLDDDDRRARVIGRRVAEQGGQRLDRRAPEQAGQRQGAAEFRLDPRQQSDRQQRMATQVEEVVRHADRPRPQRLFPERREPRFDLVPRLDPGRFAAGLGRSEGAAVDLARGGHRQFVQDVAVARPRIAPSTRRRRSSPATRCSPTPST